MDSDTAACIPRNAEAEWDAATRILYGIACTPLLPYLIIFVNVMDSVIDQFNKKQVI